MKSLKLISSILAIVVSGSVFAADPVLSLHMGGSGDAKQLASKSRSGGSIQVDFVEGDTPVVGLQFDLALDGKGSFTESTISGCGGRLSSGHQAICSITGEGNVRVIVFSATNAVIRTGTLASIRASGKGSVSIIKDSVQLGDADANPVRAEVL